jgi:hypothetical protein
MMQLTEILMFSGRGHEASAFTQNDISSSPRHSALGTASRSVTAAMSGSATRSRVVMMQGYFREDAENHNRINAQ